MENSAGQNLMKSKKSVKKFLLIIVVFAVIASSVFVWWNISISPKNASDTTKKQFIIEKGEQPRDIARKLKEQGLIRDSIAFFILVKKMGIEKSIQAGSFHISPSMTSAEIAKKLTLGTEDLWITIPEGWRSEEILDYLQKSNPFWKPTIQDEQNWRQSEGMLFPETYLVPKMATLDLIKSLMLTTFDAKITPQMRQDITANHLTINKTVIIASLVEREAKTAADRPIVASVILNRLDAGMGLDIDATVQYAIGYTKKDGWWPRELTIGDLKFDSPYNTYINSGLPPAPICNPGLAAIKAVIYPAQTDYLYYISDNSGVMHYAKSLSEHNANVAKYLGK